jgi:hypothetical protein
VYLVSVSEIFRTINGCRYMFENKIAPCNSAQPAEGPNGFFPMVLAAFMRGYTHRHFLCHGKTCTQIQSSGGQVTSTVHGTVAEPVVEVCMYSFPHGISGEPIFVLK